MKIMDFSETIAACDLKGGIRRQLMELIKVVVVVVLWFYVPPTAKVIRRRDLGLKSHPKDWRSPGSNSRPLVYKASSLTTTPRRLLLIKVCEY